MSTFKKFEEIEAWQKARELAREIYTVSGQTSFSKDFALRDQIRRAAISVMANIAEGYGRGGTKEFTQFLSVAKASAVEIMSHLYVALDQRYVDRKTFDRLSGMADEVSRMIAGLMKYLRSVQIKGPKFKRTLN